MTLVPKRKVMMTNEEKKIQETSASRWHPNAPLNPTLGGDQTETDYQASQDRPIETPASCPDMESITQVIPPVAESDDHIEHQWRASDKQSPDSRH
jgi:hypothetical protein